MQQLAASLKQKSAERKARHKGPDRQQQARGDDLAKFVMPESRNHIIKDADAQHNAPGSGSKRKRKDLGDVAAPDGDNLQRKHKKRNDPTLEQHGKHS